MKEGIAPLLTKVTELRVRRFRLLLVIPVMGIAFLLGLADQRWELGYLVWLLAVPTFVGLILEQRRSDAALDLLTKALAELGKADARDTQVAEP